MQIPTLPERDSFILETVWATEPQFAGEKQINIPNIFQTPHTNSISCTGSYKKIWTSSTLATEVTGPDTL